MLKANSTTAGKASDFAVKKHLPDSDDDGLVDALESGVNSNVCDADSDDDGKGDDDEIDDGDDPNDSDSDDDGHNDGDDIKSNGTISTLTDTSITVGDVVYIINGSTKVEGDLAVGKCVKIEYHLEGSDNIADEIEAKSASYCQ